jgi:post-segregation antitoxin (ccd killing protein)
MHDATQRWLNEQREVIAEVDRLVALYDELNARQ